MHRCSPTKLQTLEARHPGLNRKVYAMFAEFWPVAEVKQMIQSQYGERLSLRSLERYKSRQWRTQREVVRQASLALALTRLSLTRRLGSSWMATLKTGGTDWVLPADLCLSAPAARVAGNHPVASRPPLLNQEGSLLLAGLVHGSAAAHPGLTPGASERARSVAAG